MTRASSEAERLRRCREVFALAIAEQLSMAQAQREHARRRWQASEARLAARRCGTLATEAPSPAPAGAPWMMQDLDR